MIANQHIIGRLIVEAVLPPGLPMSVMENRLGDLCRDILPQALEKVCSAACPPDILLRIERLELDLGSIVIHHLERDLQEKLSAALRPAIDQVLREAQRSDRRPSAAHASSKAEEAQSGLLDDEDLLCELVTEFLSGGLLPWWAQNLPGMTLEQIFQKFLDRPSRKIQDVLQRTLRSEIPRRRIILQLSDDMLGAVIATVTGRSAKTIVACFDDLASYLQPSLPSAAHRLERWEALYKTLLTPEASASPNVESLMPAMHDVLQKRLPDLSGSVAPVESSPRMAEQGTGHDGRRPGDRPVASDLPGKHIDADAGRSFLQDRFETMETTDAGIQESARQHKTAGPERFPADRERNALNVHLSVLIRNAGLVLLWPYLGRFFDACGLLAQGKFRDSEAVVRAMHLLHFLATGTDDAPEYVLTLNKMLCGWPVDKPVSRFFRLPESDREEVLALLTNVISHWRALGNTSADGFRSAFLQRDGLLTDEEPTLILRVERKSFDLLLDRLPWSISMIRLSWMQKTLTVQW